MLEFINKRTERDVIYTPTTTAMLTTLVVFLTVVGVGIWLFVSFKSLWTNWLVWLIGSLFVYITCVSGVIYDIIHDVPFVGRHRETGEVMVFADGNREQYGAEGLVISLMIAFIGVLFISIIVMSQKMNQNNSTIGGLICLAIIFWLVMQLEDIYKAKSWYGPSFHPPQGYLTGPISRDQGNNI
jgi:oligosaccharyltransferase complex subunit gamma